MTRALLVAIAVSCGAPEPARLDSGEPHAAAVVDAGAPTAHCNCCWPAYIHGPGRCRFARAESAPVDPCESDPEQRCVMPDAGALPGL